MGEDKDEDKIKEGFEWVKKRGEKNCLLVFFIFFQFSHFSISFFFLFLLTLIRLYDFFPL